MAVRGAGDELRRIVHVNEEIKSVVATAFKINLMAMNAIFLAKRAGQTALGFGVLSNELRRFATDLQQQMAALREMTYGSVGTVTGMLKQTQLNRVLGRAHAEAVGVGRKLIDEFLRGHSEVMLQHEESLAALNRRLTHMIADTTQLVELGSVLARSAKIEAAYGGAFSVSLMQVSSDFERTIGEIQRSLETISKHQSQEVR
ncbi:MAG: chemotaxis protein [Gammaproteobacteria bacterium]|nr:chemotaxis protein [Gammaproteobacteria bacterium]MBU1647150.1 chemotaxis protein [Gammaproteobacteria bacterium]MBU1972662.1 chemotaxis protein [Gammaproteobacteria bacterium]